MTILSYKTIFGPTFSVISENLVEQFLAISKNCDFGPKLPFLERLARIRQNENFSETWHEVRGQ